VLRRRPAMSAGRHPQRRLPRLSNLSRGPITRQARNRSGSGVGTRIFAHADWGMLNESVHRGTGTQAVRRRGVETDRPQPRDRRSSRSVVREAPHSHAGTGPRLTISGSIPSGSVAVTTAAEPEMVNTVLPVGCGDPVAELARSQSRKRRICLACANLGPGQPFRATGAVPTYVEPDVLLSAHRTRSIRPPENYVFRGRIHGAPRVG
jgi:hypothetical protein